MVRPPYQALVTHSPYTLPKYMLLELPRDVTRSVARFRLRAHTLRIETVTWTHNTSPTCDLCNAHDVQNEQHVLFHCTHPHLVSLRRTDASLFSFTGLNNVSAFVGQGNNKLYFFLHALIVFYEQASSRTSCQTQSDSVRLSQTLEPSVKAFSCNPCKLHCKNSFE